MFTNSISKLFAPPGFEPGPSCIVVNNYTTAAIPPPINSVNILHQSIIWYELWSSKYFQIRSPVIGVVTRPVTAGLRQCYSGWHSIIPSSATSVGHELGRAACVFIVEVRPHHSAPSATALAQKSRADPVQARCSGVQVSARDGTILPRQWASAPGRFEARRWLRSTSLTVRHTRLSTISDRAFLVAAGRTWNSLPQHVTSAPSMSVFRGSFRLFFSDVPFHDSLTQLL